MIDSIARSLQDGRDCERSDGNGITFHTLRHAMTSTALNAGIPESLVQELGNWKSARMMRRSGHLHVRDAAQSHGPRRCHELTRRVQRATISVAKTGLASVIRPSRPSSHRDEEADQLLQLHPAAAGDGYPWAREREALERKGTR